MQHSMKLDSRPFFLIKSGRKTIEIRLRDEKRRAFKVGDQVEFVLRDEPKEKILSVITELLVFPGFDQLFDAYPVEMFGGTDKTALLDQMYRYYSAQDEAKYGVLGIKIQLL